MTGVSMTSMTLEIIEGFAAALAAPQRLAGGRAELGKQLGVVRAALWAPDLLHAKQRTARACWLGRRNAVGRKLPPALLAHPVSGPGRRQHGAHLWVTKTFALQRQLDLQRNHVHGRTAGIGRRDRDLDMTTAHAYLAQHAEICDGENRNFRIDNARRGVPGALPQIGLVLQRYHVSPGNARCIYCRSLRRWPRCSLCWPLRPPCCIQSPVGSASVASAMTPEIVLSQSGRRLALSMATPLSIRPRSASSTANISPVKAQR